MTHASAAEVIDFWFGSALEDPAAVGERNRVWFAADAAFDGEIRTRFGATLRAAAAGDLRRWQLSPRGTLALILVFDQFSRNIHRGTVAAYATDERALALCRDGIVRAVDMELGTVERLFFYLPLEHAEDPEAQARSVACFAALHDNAAPALREHTGLALRHAEEHRDLITRFGRFPHRNLVLDRASTPAELDWLREHASAYGQS